MNLRFLETFTTLARIGNVRRTAEAMHVTPSTISMRISSLEDELGHALFHHDQKGLTLTEQGARLLPHAESVLSATRRFQEAVGDSDAISGRVRVGVMESVVHTCLPALIKAVRARLPEVELDLSVDLTESLTTNLMRGTLDLILCVGKERRSAYLACQDLMNLSVHWVARRGLVPPDNFMQKTLSHPLLTPMTGTGPHQEAVFLAQQLAIENDFPVDMLRVSGSPSLAALVALAREGMGVAIVPGLFVKEQIERGELELLPLPSPPDLLVSQWRHPNAAPAVLHVAHVLREACVQYCRQQGESWVRAAA